LNKEELKLSGKDMILPYLSDTAISSDF